MAEEKYHLNELPLNVLFINGSNRKKSNSAVLTERAVDELKKYSKTEHRVFEIYNKNYGRFDDRKDTDELIEAWNWADTVIFILPNYTVGGPGSFCAALERLAEAAIEDVRGGVYKKTAGVLVQGSAQYGMAELALESIFCMLASLHTVPIYRLAAHIPDGTAPSEELLCNVDQMVEETVTGGRIYKLGAEKKAEENAEILIVNAGMEEHEAGLEIEKRVREKLSGLEGIRTEVFRFSEGSLRDCHHCNALCRKNFRCAFNDQFQEFFNKWIKSDGILWIVSGDQCGAPAEVHYVHDRLSETGFSTVWDRANRLGIPYRFCRYTKAEGAVAYGKYGFAGQTLAQQLFVNIAEQRGNYFISGRTPASLGPAALTDGIRENKAFIAETDALAFDIAKKAREIQTAKRKLYNELPELYFNSRIQMGVPDKENYFNAYRGEIS